MKFVRWILAPVVAIVVFLAVTRASILVWLFETPFSFTVPLTLALAVALGMFAGAATAPTHRWAVVTVLLTVTVLASCLYWGEVDLFIAAIFGGVLGAGVVVLWFHPRRPHWSRKWILAGAGLFVAGWLILIECYRRDWLMRPDPLPDVLGTNITGAGACYTQDLGGFLDEETLWRLDVSPEGFCAITNRLRLTKAASVPEQFWNHSPRWWPGRLPAGGTAFHTENFKADQRGPDGNHYFLLYDKNNNRIFVWEKSNF